MNATTLPILDLARYADPAEKAAFLADLRHAARDIGFFYLINHGVDESLQQAVQQQSRAFFALPDDQKQRVAMIHSPHFRGYNRVGINPRSTRLARAVRYRRRAPGPAA